MTLETKEHILNVIINELNKDEVEKVTIKELAKLSHLARSTMYFQFSSIGEIYSYLVNVKILNEALEKNCCHEVLEELVKKCEDNFKICSKLFLITDEYKRKKFFYDKLYNYFIEDCKCLNNYEFNEYKKEMRLLTEYLIFHLEIWFDKEIDFCKEDFLEQSNNYINYLNKRKFQ